MFPCPVCNVKLNSAEQRRAHCRGKNHIKREEARKKAQELGTDFDSTPDHCDVCNVPLTSKMTAIDHFKGKMHQKKVKSVEEQRQGFKNYCEICEAHLQSLKVSEAHFNGKLHQKRERKANSGKGLGKKIPAERKSSKPRTSWPRTEDFSSSQDIIGVVFKETPKNSSSWENPNCDNDVDPKDPLGEFRNSLNGKSLSSPEPFSSTSPGTSTEPLFSFDMPFVPKTSALISPITDHTLVYKTAITGRQSRTAEQKNGFVPYFNGENVPKIVENTGLGNSWRSPGNIQHLNETQSSTLPFTVRAKPVKVHNEHVLQTQAVVFVLKEAGQGISSGDIATRIPGLTPSDVNVILNDLEKHNLVSKSGCVPIMWSLVGSSPPKQACKTLNGFAHPHEVASKEPHYFQTSKELYLGQNEQKIFPRTEAYTALTTAILPVCPIGTTTTAPSDMVRPYTNVIESNHASAYPPVIESNLVNMFQQNGSLSEHEIKTKLNLKDEARLRFMLQKLLERNVIDKDGDQHWRLRSSTRSNVGVIGEERRRRSPMQSESSSESSSDRSPSPPKESGYRLQNGYHTSTTDTSISNVFHTSTSSKEDIHRVVNSFHNSVSSQKETSHSPRVRNGFDTEMFPPKNGYTQADQHNGMWQELNNSAMNGKVVQNSHNNNNKRNRSSPPLPLKTETSEVLEDLTVATPKAYQKELYKKAMQEDTVCYLPLGTGKDLVIAQVIAHMVILNPTKEALVIVPDIVSALNIAPVLRRELGSNSKRKKLNVALHAGQLKQSNGKAHVYVVTSSTCLGLLNCGALSWKDVCLLIFDQAMMCRNDEASKKILHEYYLKAKMETCNGHIPKLLSFIDSSAGQANLDETVRTFESVLSSMGDVFLSSVIESKSELEQDKHEAMFVCVQSSLNEEESKMFFLLGTYLNLVFDNLGAQWQPLNNYRELLKISFTEGSVISEAFVKLIHLTGQPLEKRLPASCLKTWRHYLAIGEVIFALVECGEDIAKDLLMNLAREDFGFAWANDVGLPGFELSQQLMEKEIPNGSSSFSNHNGSGLRELLEQLMIIQWENARVSSERPLALVIVKLNKTAKILANYLARWPQLVKRNVRTTFVDASRSHQQKAVMSAIKRRQYQVIVSTDNIKQDELPHCELVVLLDQPTSVFALDQLRTRRATNVVAICRHCDGEDNMKELLRREEFVEKAVTCIRSGTMC